LVCGACAHPFGDENSAPSPFEVLVVNESGEPLYFTTTEPEVTEPGGRFSAVRSGEEVSIGMGRFGVEDRPGGCFDKHLWFFRSVSNRPYPQGTDISEHLDDIELVGHFLPGECTDQEQIIFEYDGR
jgi:hypothetical protein